METKTKVLYRVWTFVKRVNKKKVYYQPLVKVD